MEADATLGGVGLEVGSGIAKLQRHLNPPLETGSFSVGNVDRSGCLPFGNVDVMDPNRAIVEVENFHYATSQLAQTTLRSVLGQADLDDLLSQRERLNQQLQHILDQRTDPWGIKVSSVEVKHVDLPPDMQRAMAKQAEAEREKRAKIIHAAGEYEASEKLSQAANVIATEPIAITLRYLQTLTEIASEKNSTIIFPLPIEVLHLVRQAVSTDSKA